MDPKTLRFTYYSRLKNEDCEPIIFEDDHFLVVACADGLGGSGSYRHDLKNKAEAKVAYKNALLKLSETIDYDPFEVCVENQVCEKLDDVLNCFVDGLFDNYDKSKGNLFTSASLASRAVLYSFLLWGVKEGFNSENVSLLSQTIMSGLNHIVDEFHLSLDGNNLNVMRLVPSTFTAAVIDKENKKLISLNCGDSRNFVLTPDDGLKTLSTDDEDASGSITRLFYIGADIDGRNQITRTVSVLPEQCIILATSDGFFLLDEFGNLVDEYFILDSIKSHKSFYEFANTLKKHINSIHQDDCSIALASYGYNKLQDIYSSFKARKIMIENKYKDLNHCYPLFDFFVRGDDGLFRIKTDEEILEDNKIYSRISDLLNSIWSSLLIKDVGLKKKYVNEKTDAFIKSLNDNALFYDDYTNLVEFQYPSDEEKIQHVISYMKDHRYDKELNRRISKFANYRNYLKLKKDNNKVQSIINFLNDEMI